MFNYKHKLYTTFTQLNSTHTQTQSYIVERILEKETKCSKATPKEGDRQLTRMTEDSKRTTLRGRQKDKQTGRPRERQTNTLI